MNIRRAPLLLASGVLATSTLAFGPGSAGGAAPCEEPYSPVAAAISYPDQEELPPVDADPVPTTVLDLPPQTFDSDGDGTDDTVVRNDGSLTITRGDGVVELTTDGPIGAVGLGDIDGDDRDEFIVQTAGDLYVVPGTVPTGPAAIGDDRDLFNFQSAGDLYVVPGTVPTGTAAIGDAAIRLPFGAAHAVYVADGSDRLLVFRPPGNSIPAAITDVLDGTDVLALGPGGDAGTLTPTLTLPGLVRFGFEMGGPALVLVAGEPVDQGGPAAAIELSLVDGTDIVELTTFPETFRPEYVSPYGGVEILVGPDGTFVTLSQSSRGGGATYLWSLTDPCTRVGGVEATTSTTSTVPAGTAPAAQPVRAAADFTG